MRPFPTRATIALGLLAGAVLWNAAAFPATASGSTSWREEGHFDTSGACQRAGKEGIRKHRWDEYKCRPGRGDAYVTLWVRGGRSRAGAHHAPAR